MRFINIKAASWDVSLILLLASYDNVNALANQERMLSFSNFTQAIA